MALRNEEIVRIKYELGYNVTAVGAEFYIAYHSVFDRAIQPYLIDLSTTSATAVTADEDGASVDIVVVANPAVTNGSDTQTLAFVVGGNVVVGHGPSQETSVIEAISGLTLTMTLFNAHSGTYAVAVQGSEQIIRDCFDRLDQIKTEMLNVAPKVAGLAALTGEVEFFSSGRNNRKGGRSKFEELIFQRTIARRDLAGALGVPYLPDMGGGDSNFEVY
jgi:hypothetical protein